MSKAFLDLLIELAEDPLRARKFKANPAPDLRRAGLSKEEKDALRSRDPARIRAVMAAESPERDWMLLSWLTSLTQDGEEAAS